MTWPNHEPLCRDPHTSGATTDYAVRCDQCQMWCNAGWVKRCVGFCSRFLCERHRDHSGHCEECLKRKYGDEVGFYQVCPRDIYSHTVRNKDRQIVASIHDRKETRSTTPRLGSAVPAGPHPEYDIGNHLRAWRPVRWQARPGGMTAYPPTAMAAVCIMPGQDAPPTARRRAFQGTTTP